MGEFISFNYRNSIEKSIKKRSSRKKRKKNPTNQLSFRRLPSPTKTTVSNMPASGVQVADECVDSYESMKQKRKYKYCIYKLSDNLKHIVVDKVFDNPGCGDRPTNQGDYGPFWDYLQQIQENRDCRCACFDIRYVTSEGGHRNKLTFIVFCPDEANVKKKMLYASSKDALKNKLIGNLEIQASDLDDLVMEEVVSKCLNTTTYR